MSTAANRFLLRRCAQPQSFTRIAPEWANGLIIAPLMSVASPLNPPDIVGDSVLTVAGSPTITRTTTPLGIGYQCHPGGGTSGATWVDWLSPFDVDTSDFTAIWIGRIDNNSGNGQLLNRGDITGGNDSVRLVAISSNTIRFTFIDSTPAANDVSVFEPSMLTGSMQRFALTKRGTALALYSWNAKASATGTAGTATARPGASHGWLIGANAGHAATVQLYVWSHAKAPDVLWQLLANPWQVWAPEEYPITIAATGPTFQAAWTAAANARVWHSGGVTV